MFRAGHSGKRSWLQNAATALICTVVRTLHAVRSCSRPKLRSRHVADANQADWFAVYTCNESSHWCVTIPCSLYPLLETLGHLDPLASWDLTLAAHRSLALIEVEMYKFRFIPHRHGSKHHAFSWFLVAQHPLVSLKWNLSLPRKQKEE